MKDLLSELVQACYRAAGGATDEAEKHIIEALKLLNDALDGRPARSLQPVRSGCISTMHALQLGTTIPVGL